MDISIIPMIIYGIDMYVIFLLRRSWHGSANLESISLLSLCSRLWTNFMFKVLLLLLLLLLFVELGETPVNVYFQL